MNANTTSLHSSPTTSSSSIPRLNQARETAIRALLDARDPDGIWRGRLSSSAVATATAVIALDTNVSATIRDQAEKGKDWLCQTQNPDGSWGDTPESPGNLSATLLAWAALSNERKDSVDRAQDWLKTQLGDLTPATITRGIHQIYGDDHTFATPILAVCAYRGLLGPQPAAWKYVAQLPFEWVLFPRSWLARLHLSVVSYALPALVAIGLMRHRLGPPADRRGTLRKWCTPRALRLLRAIQPESGGFLEAIPLTAFVHIGLQASELSQEETIGLQTEKFLRTTQREDGSWPIDTDLGIWLTTLAVNALSKGASRSTTLEPSAHERILRFLLRTQQKRVHPYTLAQPGGWAWTERPGGVPDSDDSAGALLALHQLAPHNTAVHNAAKMGIHRLLKLQNRDGGFPTFCRGWTRLPFDISCPDITAHVLRAFHVWHPAMPTQLQNKINQATTRAIRYLLQNQRPDGAWIPLWFGSQQTDRKENPVFGTAQVLRALTVVAQSDNEKKSMAAAAAFLLQAQHADGAWGGDAQIPASLEETALATTALAGLPKPPRDALARAGEYISQQILSHPHPAPSPIGLYFSSLWYAEDLYPLIFSVSSLNNLRTPQKNQSD